MSQKIPDRSIQVLCSFRALTAEEVRCKDIKLVDITDKSFVMEFQNRRFSHSFDQVFGITASSRDVFENSILKRNIIEYISKGKSAFFMVYGYHGTGKTYTLYGSLEEFFGSTPVPPLSSYLPVKSRSALLKRKGEDSKTVNSKAFNAFLLDEFHGVIIHTANAIFEYI